MHFITTQRQLIRTYIRSLRHATTFSQQYVAAQLITNKIIIHKNIHQSKHIATFISYDGEINTSLLIQTLLSINKKIYLPIVTTSCTKSQHLLFAQYTLSTPLVRNHLNIYEPKCNLNSSSVVPIEALDIIFVPLVAFDDDGNRLGMGGGFYDKTLQHWNKQANYIPIGLAYDFQKIPSQILTVKKWDIKLPEIITPSFHYFIKIT